MGPDTSRFVDVVMGGCGSSILIDNQRGGHQSERGGESKADMRWCRNNHPREWETELTREIDQGCQESRGHIGGLWP